MNSKTILSLVFVASIFFTSCKKELEPQDSSETPLTETATAATPAPGVQPQVQATPAPAPVQAGQPVQQAAPVTATAPGMNPPHGQPNHRCDIAVGAPLNSPKGQMPTAKPAQKPAATLEKVTPQSAQPQPAVVTETAPGMNPPHGQPGHRCDVAVGAKLPTE